MCICHSESLSRALEFVVVDDDFSMTSVVDGIILTSVDESSAEARLCRPRPHLSLLTLSSAASVMVLLLDRPRVSCYVAWTYKTTLFERFLCNRSGRVKWPGIISFSWG